MGKYNKAELRKKRWHDMSKMERIVAARWKLVPKVRSERERQLRTRYNMLLEDYDRMMKEQDGVCKICLDDWGRALYVDHNHETGEVRGLLCATCNTFVGFLETSPERLELVMNYLEKNGSE